MRRIARDRRQRIFYFLLPNSRWPNVGDHAQVFAIRRWLKEYFPDREVYAFDKDETLVLANDLARIVRAEDIILLHSGGNMNPKAEWSESGRRTVIESFPDNPIIQLPQTISLPPSHAGEVYAREVREIYRKHKRLLLFARDPVSADIGERLMGVPISAYPDFALTIDPAQFTGFQSGKGILACMRQDGESIGLRKKVISALTTEKLEFTLTDTHLDQSPEQFDPDIAIAETIRLFMQHEVIITDRFHGTIFGVICKKRVIVLPTHDHKLTSAVQWFDGFQNLSLCDTADRLIEELRRETFKPPQHYDWHATHFNQLANILKRFAEDKAKQHRM